MITFLIILPFVFAAYWFLLRPMFRQWAAFKPFYDKLDAVEATGTFKLRMSIKGLKTVLIARFVMLASILLPILQMAGSIDLTGFLPPIHYGEMVVPATVYVPTMVVPLLSALMEFMRRVSTTPTGSPVPEQVTVTEVPTVEGKPDVVIETAGVAVGPAIPVGGA